MVLISHEILMRANRGRLATCLGGDLLSLFFPPLVAARSPANVELVQERHNRRLRLSLDQRIMAAVEPSDVVAQLWSRVQARDWVGVGDLLAEDFVLEWPHDRVRLRGRANFVEFNRSYPEGWSIEVLRIVAQGNTVVSEVRVPHPTVGPHYALSFYEVDGGRIASCREYWVPETYEEPVAERARWFEPM